MAHNTKLFKISLKWVSLLSEEFWREGDLEKKKNLPVSFLCDRDKINIPQSQKGFISGFIIPTFENLTLVFPSLKFTLDNANNNLKEWQKLLDEGRLKGWTPKKDKKKNKIKHKIIIGTILDLMTTILFKKMMIRKIKVVIIVLILIQKTRKKNNQKY